MFVFGKKRDAIIKRRQEKRRQLEKIQWEWENRADPENPEWVFFLFRALGWTFGERDGRIRVPAETAAKVFHLAMLLQAWFGDGEGEKTAADEYIAIKDFLEEDMKEIMMGAKQRAKIFALAKERGMDTDLLHAYVEALVGKDSLKKLTSVEAFRVIDGLSGKEVTSRFPQREVLTEKQKKLIISLAIRLGWVRKGTKNLADLDRLNRFVQVEYGTLYLKALSRSKASKCIEALKSMLERKGNKQ